MRLRELLDEQNIHYEWTRHAPTYTSQGLAAELHQSGNVVVKPVLVEADGKLVVCAVPAPRKVNPAEVKQVLHANEVHLASEQQMKDTFYDCELGAEPPIGRLYALKTLMDDSLVNKSRITFQAGTHREAVTMAMQDYLHLADPTVAHITFG